MTWKNTRLKFLASQPIQNGLGEAGAHDNPDWPRYIRTTDIAGSRELRDDVFASLPPDVAKKAPLQSGDLLMTAAGATIGKSFLYLDDYPACYAGYLARFRGNQTVDPRFIAYWAESSPYWDQIRSGKVVSTIENFSASKYQNMRLSVPSLLIQQGIADYLDRETARIDALIAGKQKLMDLLLERVQVLKARWYAQLAAEAGTMPLRRLLVSLEQGWSPQCDSSPADASEWGVLKTSSVSSGSFIPAENKCLPETEEPDLRWLVRDNDLLIVRGSGSLSAVGQAAVAKVGKRKLLISDLIYRVRLRSALPEFVAMALQSSQARQQVEGSIRSDIGQTLKVRGGDLKDLLVPAIHPSKQDEAVRGLFADLDHIFDVALCLKTSIKLLHDRRRVLITAAVTGQLDIPEAS